MADKPLPEALTALLRFNGAMQLESILTQVIDRARKGESFFSDEIVGLEGHRAEIAEQLKQLCSRLWFLAMQMTPDGATDLDAQYDPSRAE